MSAEARAFHSRTAHPAFLTKRRKQYAGGPSRSDRDGSASSAWRLLAAELEERAARGRPAVFWLRDDDAVAPTAPLDRLLGLAGENGVPLMLAVIPAPTGEALAARLDGERGVAVAVHGWSHENHAPAGEKKEELGSHRPGPTVAAELAEGLAKLRAVHAGRLVPVLVPPWNRIDRHLIPELPGLGFKGLSTFGPPKPSAMPTVNATVDIVDWRGGGRCRPHAALAGEIVGQLRSGFGSNERPLGILTHHLVHDEEAWSFLARLFSETGRLGCRWLSAGELFGGGARPGTGAV